MARIPAQDNNSGMLVINVSSDTRMLEEKLEIIKLLKLAFFESVNNKFSIAFNNTIHLLLDRESILFSELVITSWTEKPNELICVFDFDITNFLRKWVAAIRASERDSFTHD